MSIIGVEILKTTDEKKNAESNQIKTNKDRKEQGEQKL